jgi:hypothetical protein
MAKRIATSGVDSLQAGLALEAVLNTEQGLNTALRHLSNIDDANLRTRLEELGYVVTKRVALEALVEEVYALKDVNRHNSPDEREKTKIIDKISKTKRAYRNAGMRVPLRGMKEIFETYCLTSSNYGYSSTSRHNLRNGMVNRGDSDMHHPDPQAGISWTTYYAGGEGQAWARRVLEALGVPETDYEISDKMRVIGVKWRKDVEEAASVSVNSDDED